MPPIDLNDLYYFAQAVEAGGFSAAARKLGMPKATLSHRIAKLEERLGVRQLIQRNTRQFSPTNIGKLYYEHCASLRAQADSAQHIIEQYGGSDEVQGVVRLSCPVEILEQYVNDMLVAFMQRHPDICLDVWAVNRYVDVVEEQRDFAIRAKTFPLPDSDLVVRPLLDSPQFLAASPELVPHPVHDLADLAALPGFVGRHEPPYEWRFKHAVHGWCSQPFRPKIASRNLNLIKRAVLAGQGIAVLPYVLIADKLKQGQLVSVLSDEWAAEHDTVHAVYPSRSGMPPAVIKLLDFLGECFAAKGLDG